MYVHGYTLTETQLILYCVWVSGYYEVKVVKHLSGTELGQGAEQTPTSQNNRECNVLCIP